ncbi:MAG TPA: pyroglutamyl-peptidase I [Acetobacteraceae bacterium]|nr:pyroglutamyl-peptidase I [Acetobacteraceae bacterium]
MRILITGFEPFGGDSVNPSAELVWALNAAPPPGIDLAAAILPCAFAVLPGALEAAVARHEPDILLGFGLATGRPGLSVERIAINIIDARIPDNEGAQPLDEPVIKGGPAAYFSTIPIKSIFARLNDAGIPAAVSQTAGTFVCNAMMYRALHLADRHPPLRAGFIHVPCLPSMPEAQAGAPSLDSAILRDAGKIILETLRDEPVDRRIFAGTVA